MECLERVARVEGERRVLAAGLHPQPERVVEELPPGVAEVGQAVLIDGQ